MVFGESVALELGKFHFDRIPTILKGKIENQNSILSNVLKTCEKEVIKQCVGLAVSMEKPKILQILLKEKEELREDADIIKLFQALFREEQKLVKQFLTVFGNEFFEKLPCNEVLDLVEKNTYNYLTTWCFHYFPFTKQHSETKNNFLHLVHKVEKVKNKQALYQFFFPLGVSFI